ncbi:X-Pro dipeptidyl-peptidase (S15 family) [Enhygromyxa salina]|uniref:X-Pro dipeptidyl-peptidase (S15 family) n=1 Tax=Enhygromyxa salina TaxID=215803 RepID=A0A2S9YAD5_9BACT|nr:CocE/NonD family hydrolase [Enhygromyxa salina]PRQ02067.1 X-Pro dipeptidyl-peptidase (S15 family) [Enhygromyxa salina]
MLRSPGLLVVPLLFAVTSPLTACSDNAVADGDDTGESGESSADTASEDYVAAEFMVRESVRQLHITHADPGVELRVVDANGEEVERAVVDDLGSLIFRELAPGDGYSIEETGDFPREVARDLLVMSSEGSYPDPSFYEAQVLEPGFNYIMTRDGTMLSAYVALPGPPEDGPYPTIVNYSGYDPSQPGGSLNDQFDLEGLDLETLCPTFPVICDAPHHPSGILAGFLGFATVGVNMRGTGCSGGAYDFFEELQVLDGYDIIETIAAQDWVLGNQVGMAGLSYPGISQMWVAQTQPPSLAAIAPLSIFAHTGDSTLRPGGITNYGFALNWADNVLDGALPYGKGWEQGLVEAGDTICEENQLLHGQYVDVIQKTDDHPYYEPEVFDPLTPLEFVGDIDVPVFVTGAWQDEQTGGDFAPLFNAFTGSPLVKFTMFNGVHADGYVPEHLIYWGAFFDFYLREEIPVIPGPLRNIGPALFSALLGEPVEFPPDPYAMYGSFDEAFAAFEAEDPIKLKFEMGNSEEYSEGIPQSAWEMSFTSWPPDEVVPERWYFQPDGALSTTAPLADGGASSFHIDSLDADTSILDGDINTPLPPWNWPQDQSDTAAVFLSEELETDVVMVGPASADLWIRSNAGEADLEVNISEVRPDGQEMYIQSGWLRATQRGLNSEKSTDLAPVQTHAEADVEPVPSEDYVLARVQVFPFAHAFRAGSRIRISVDTPGASRAEWLFVLDETQTDSTRIDVAHGADGESSILLPVIPDQVIPTALPPCPSLRGQPCREFVDFTNTAI